MRDEPPLPSPDDPRPRYGEFPELFWDLKPEFPVDVTNESILARILREGSLNRIIQLVPLDVLRNELPTLFIPEHRRRFWTRVIEIVDERAASDA